MNFDQEQFHLFIKISLKNPSNSVSQTYIYMKIKVKIFSKDFRGGQNEPFLFGCLRLIKDLGFSMQGLLIGSFVIV